MGDPSAKGEAAIAATWRSTDNPCQYEKVLRLQEPQSALVKATRIFIEQEMAATFVGRENIEFCAGNRFSNPTLTRGRVNAAGTAEHQGWMADPFDDCTPVLNNVIGKKIGGEITRKLEIFARDLLKIGFAKRRGEHRP